MERLEDLSPEKPLEEVDKLWPVDVVTKACLSSNIYQGREKAEFFLKMLQEKSEKKVTSASEAMVKALNYLVPPYTQTVNEKVGILNPKVSICAK